MNNISLIYNTGIQYVELEPKLKVDLGSGTGDASALYFVETANDNQVDIEPAYYFHKHRECLRRADLIKGGYLYKKTNDLVDESEIAEDMKWLPVNSCIRISKLTDRVGALHEEGLSLIENKWLPMPYFENTEDGMSQEPTNWCRIKLIPIKSECNEEFRVYKVLLAFDTSSHQNTGKETPVFLGERYRNYSLCGVNSAFMEHKTAAQKDAIENRLIPLKAFDFCNTNRQPWLNRYLRRIFKSKGDLPVGEQLRYIAFYTYLITTLHKRQILPDIKLYNDEGNVSIGVNLILDIGNSRTFGLVAEDPIDPSFSKTAVVQIRDLGTGELYPEPFDMRLCFKKEDFGVETPDGAFRWPSVVRLGKEALRNIYEVTQDFESDVQYDTNYSSPKRYLWDNEAYRYQWKFITKEQDQSSSQQQSTIDYEGLMQQFHNDGRFASDPQQMGDKSCYSRRSLMTFCFIEILLQVRQQINSYEFRRKNGKDYLKREIRRVILTCPTAMTREEQIALRQSMEEASVVIERYYSNTFNVPYVKRSANTIEIIPSVEDLMLSPGQMSLRNSWSYDEATCCQMVYLYGELRRYLGNAKELFKTYGRKRNGATVPSLTIGSLDIGAGTSDIMIANYSTQGQTIQPKPLFWESFKLAGDDLIKRIVTDILLEVPRADYPNASGIIRAKLNSIGINPRDAAERVLHFFGEGATMGVLEQRMRKEFLVQISYPLASFLLEKLRKGDKECELSFDQIFKGEKPSKELLDFFANQIGFRFEDLIFIYSPKFLNEIILRVYAPAMRKWAALFRKYQCDIVLLGGRPCSLKEIYSLMKRLLPVTPDRLISMINYRVGSWYPGATDRGFFKDNKSLVAVGALIAYLAEKGELHEFSLQSALLKTDVLPTSDYIGILNLGTGIIENVVTPTQNTPTITVPNLPIYFGTKQLDTVGYMSSMLYVLHFNEKNIREEAIKNLRKKMNLPTDGSDSTISPNAIANEIDRIKTEIRFQSPLKVSLERDFRDDKEQITIASVTDKNNSNVTAEIELSLKTWSDESTNWLDSGVFKLSI